MAHNKRQKNESRFPGKLNKLPASKSSGLKELANSFQICLKMLLLREYQFFRQFRENVIFLSTAQSEIITLTNFSTYVTEYTLHM